MSETTPETKSATGPKLEQKYAEITLPEGWKIDENSADGALVQGSSSSGILTMIEIKDGPEGPVANSLDALAKVELGVIGDPAVRRLDDAVIGEDTPAYRLAGRTGFGNEYYKEYYGVIMGDVEYSIEFNFYTPDVTVVQAKKVIKSILSTWRFNP